MNIADIESQLRDLVDQPFDPAEFPFAFLTIYDAAKATVTKLRQGAANQAKAPGDVLLKNKLFFRAAAKGSAADTLDEISADPLTERHRPRFLITTDGVEVYARDVKADQTLDIAFGKLNDSFDFFLPLAGFERHEGVAENPADIKATGRLAKLYDAILEANPDWLDVHGTHELNLFMTRMLFCFFAEDTAIFADGAFTSAVMSLTAEDGSDTSSVLASLFRAMNSPNGDRDGLPSFATKFPYVNGGLFREEAAIPSFSKRARRLFRECGELHWRDINPDIFGSMIQAVVEPGLRGDMGMHYTSVPNIMNVLQPLFLNSLEEEFEAARDSEAKLGRLLLRLYNIRVFDPACGSGNFLIIAYRELRKMETRVFRRQQELAKQARLPLSGVRLAQFYGIELADFAAETAKLSLWIAEYQLNLQFRDTFGSAPPALPLSESGNIRQGNATRLAWETVCPPSGATEIYVVGNPPYVGSSNQTAAQKTDMDHAFARITKSYKNLDYVAIWFLRGAAYCATANAKCAFVSTNSICQGEQVAMMWPLIYKEGIEIGFGHQAFKWKNNAANNAGVTCIIVGLRKKSGAKKTLISGSTARVVKNIGPYLIEMDDTIVEKENRPQNGLPKMDWGNKPTDDGNFILTPKERDDLLSKYPEASSFVRRFYGSQEFIKGVERFCLWITDATRANAEAIPPIAERIEAVRAFRAASTAVQTREYAEFPHRFRQIQNYGVDAIVVPIHFSEGRGYCTIGILEGDTSIVSNACYAIYDAQPYVLSLLSSRLHAVWIASVCGQLETRIRYSNTMGYHTFPVPALSQQQQSMLEELAWELIAARESHPGRTIAWLYDEKTMPDNVLRAHEAIDAAVEEIYLGRAFKSDSERLEHLFRMYARKTKRPANTDARRKNFEVA